MPFQDGDSQYTTLQDDGFPHMKVHGPSAEDLFHAQRSHGVTLLPAVKGVAWDQELNGNLHTQERSTVRLLLPALSPESDSWVGLIQEGRWEVELSYPNPAVSLLRWNYH